MRADDESNPEASPLHLLRSCKQTMQRMVNGSATMISLTLEAHHLHLESRRRENWFAIFTSTVSRASREHGSATVVST